MLDNHIRLHPANCFTPPLPHHRFTRPTLDVVIRSWRLPRPKVTVVLEAPHPAPIGEKTTSGLDTSRFTPRVAGPANRRNGTHPAVSRTSTTSDSGLIRTRAARPSATASWRATARAMVTSWAAPS